MREFDAEGPIHRSRILVWQKTLSSAFYLLINLLVAGKVASVFCKAVTHTVVQWHHACNSHKFLIKGQTAISWPKVIFRQPHTLFLQRRYKFWTRNGRWPLYGARNSVAALSSPL